MDVALKANEAWDLCKEMWELVRERGFGRDYGDPIGNNTRLGVDVAKVVPDVVAEEECGLNAHQGAFNWAHGATFLEPGFALNVVTLEEEDWM